MLKSIPAGAVTYILACALVCLATMSCSSNEIECPPTPDKTSVFTGRLADLKRIPLDGIIKDAVSRVQTCKTKNPMFGGDADYVFVDSYALPNRDVLLRFYVKNLGDAHVIFQLGKDGGWKKSFVYPL